MALFLFFSLTKAALTFLSIAQFVALMSLFAFRLTQFVPVFSLKPSPFCKFFAGLGSINKSAISLLSDSRPVLDLLFSPPSLPQTLWRFWQELSFPLLSFTIRGQWIPRHSFLLGNDKAEEMVRSGALLLPFAVPCSPSLTSRIHSSLFSDWRRTV